MASPEDEAKKTDESPEETELEVTDGDDALAEESTSEPEPDNEEASADDDLDETVSLVDQLELALDEVAKFKDVALRAEAEMQNIQRRTSRDIENAHKFALERFVQNLLPVVDSLEKAVEASEQAGESAAAIAEGVGLCHKLLLDVLSKESVEVIDPMGEPFDPNEHQAMSMVENPDMEPNSVFAVVQKGYKLNGRLVRAAMVMVTKAPAEPVAESQASEDE